MENFGKIKTIQSEKYLNETSADTISKFMDIIKKSNKLQKEFKIYKSLENAHIPSEILAMKHIDRNVSNRTMLHESDLDKIQEFNEDISIDPDKEKLYESIHTLLHDDNPDNIHESYVYVLKHIQNNKPIVEENVIEYPKGVDREFILEMAVNKFNERYGLMDEDEKDLFNSLSTTSYTEKKELFESLKKETIDLTNDGDNNGIEDKINEAIDSINKIEFSEETANSSIIKLTNYKNYLIS